MSLNDVASVTISASGPAPSMPGFGTGLIAAYHNIGGARRVMGPYADLPSLQADFPSSNPLSANVVNPATKYFAQNPAPSQVYVGRRANAFSQVATLTPQTTAAGTVYQFTVGAVMSVGGTQITYTVPSSRTLAQVCTDIAAAMAAAATAYGFTTDATSGTHITCSTTAAGTLVEYQVQVPASILRFASSTADPGIAADLTAIYAENKNWYGLLLDSNSKNEILAAAAWVESNGTVIFAATTSDSDAADNAVTTDVLSTLKANSYFRTAGLFIENSNMSYGAAGWLAGRLVATPGSDTWHLKTISSVQVDSDLLCPESSVTAVLAKNGTVYVTLAGLNVTLGGTSGGGEWMDQTRFIDWLHATIQIRTFGTMAGAAKIPFTDLGILILDSVLKGCLQDGVNAGGIVDGSIKTTPPTAASVSTANRQARILPSLPWTAQLAGAIHRVTINGVLTA